MPLKSRFCCQPPRLLSWSLLGFCVVFNYVGQQTNAHVVAWHKGMYCLNGTNPKVNDQNTGTAVKPLHQLKKADWWFHHVDLCDQFPPAPGDFLELPANGNFTVELANNRAATTLSYNGRYTSPWTDGKNHTTLGEPVNGESRCITSPNIHTQNETMAAGTVFAISYVSELSRVTEENLVVFTALYHTPWRRLATYQVPDLPACPEPGGCICAWGWVPNGCGEANMYMLPYRCRVIGKTGNAAVAPGKPPVWCEDNPSKCVKGAKQMVFWKQQEGNNVMLEGYDLSGRPKSPGYNMKMGFFNGAQNDIFLAPGSAQPVGYVNPKLAPSDSTKPLRSLHQSSMSLKSSAFVLTPVLTSGAILSIVFMMYLCC